MRKCSELPVKSLDLCALFSMCSISNYNSISVMKNPSKPVPVIPVALPVIGESVDKQMIPSGCQSVHEQRYKAEVKSAQCSKRIWCYEKGIFCTKWCPHIMHTNTFLVFTKIPWL